MQVFTPFQKFQEPEAIVGAVTPSAWMTGPLLDRPDGLLPLIAFGNRITLEIVAPWHAQEGGFQGRRLLHQVNSVAVRTATVSWREQRNLVEPERPGMASRNDKPSGFQWRYPINA